MPYLVKKQNKTKMERGRDEKRKTGKFKGTTNHKQFKVSKIKNYSKKEMLAVCEETSHEMF